MQLTDDRNMGSDAGGGFVERSQVVQVQHITSTGVSELELAAPGSHLSLVVEVIKLGKHDVRRPRPVLEGGM